MRHNDNHIFEIHPKIASKKCFIVNYIFTGKSDVEVTFQMYTCTSNMTGLQLGHIGGI